MSELASATDNGAQPGNGPAPAESPEPGGAARRAAFHESLQSEHLNFKVPEFAPAQEDQSADPPADKTIEVPDAPPPAQEAKVLLELRKKEAALKKAEADHGALLPKYEQATKQLELLAKDPIAALRHAGLTPQAFVDKLLAKEVAAAPEYPPEIQALLDEAKQLKDEKARALAEAKQKEEYDRNIAAVKADIAAVADQYPLLSARPNAAELVYQAWDASGGKESLESLLAEGEKAVLTDLVFFLSDPKLAQVVLKDPKVSAAIQQLGGTSPAASHRGPTRSNNGVAAQNPITQVASREPEDPFREVPLHERMQGAEAAARRAFAR